MPFSKSCSDSSSGSSSLSSRRTISSRSWKAFSNSLDFARGIVVWPDRFDAHRLRVDGAFQTAFLQLNFDRIADVYGGGIENGFPSIARARKSDRITARENGQRRNSVQGCR